MGDSRLTVREIARLAGVSVATVSRVSNGTGQVSEEMRRRVLDAIEKHGYRPDHLGRALAAGRHGALGLVFPGLSGPYFTELIQGFESEAVPSRASVHILCTHLRSDSDAQVLEMGRRVDGVAVIGGTISDPTLLRLAEMVPVVVVAGQGPDGVPAVRAENVATMAELTRHLLLDHELTDLVFVGSPGGVAGRQRTLGRISRRPPVGGDHAAVRPRRGGSAAGGTASSPPNNCCAPTPAPAASSVPTTRRPSVSSSERSVGACGCRRTSSSPGSTTPRSPLWSTRR